MPKIQVELNDYENEVVTTLQKANKGYSKEKVIKMIISKVKLREVDNGN